MPTFIIEREIPGAVTLTQQEPADITSKPDEVVGKELDMFTTRSRRLVAAAAGLALAAGLATGCGTSSLDRRGTAVAASADAMEERAQEYVGDPWERRSITEHQRSQQYVGDPWERRSIAEHQRMLREHRERQP